MAVNRGKAFEDSIRKGFERVANTSVTRLIDPQAGYLGVGNICDFIVYKYPRIFFIECKSVHGNTMSINTNDPKRKYGMLSNTQWEGLLKQSDVNGVVAGVFVWFIDHDKTIFIPIKSLVKYKNQGFKSINITNMWDVDWIPIDGTKKRINFDYDFSRFLK